jgi:hypothetical protein
MHSSELSRARARAEYSPRWLLVPLVPVVISLAVWFVTLDPVAVDDASPLPVDAVDATPAPHEAHGA